MHKRDGVSAVSQGGEQAPETLSCGSLILLVKNISYGIVTQIDNSDVDAGSTFIKRDDKRCGV